MKRDLGVRIGDLSLRNPVLVASGIIGYGREYEHLVLALSAPGGRPTTTYLPLPHPSGLAWDAERRQLHVASTRNPNAVYALRPARALGTAAGRGTRDVPDRPLLGLRPLGPAPHVSASSSSTRHSGSVSASAHAVQSPA